MQPSTTHKSKAMQFMELREQVKQLEQTAVKLRDNMDTTIKQVPSIRKLTTLQSAVFLSAGRVLNPPFENTKKR
ncbi:hypothetical protein MAM1_0005d00603 [Mucor ambiguus]|uniref:Uncharacterized protein n=1 Tax=Mucor ambiguus TaxID=91626 RepID=A0A0C9MDW5_9FUNG|nr:hypothetical protein MAM1_0005d00603 [Mucor ambiguus]